MAGRIQLAASIAAIRSIVGPNCSAPPPKKMPFPAALSAIPYRVVSNFPIASIQVG